MQAAHAEGAEDAHECRNGDVGQADAAKTLARIGILVVSDRASRGIYEDKSGKAVSDFLGRVIRSNWIVIFKIVPDGAESVAEALIELADHEGCDLVLTTAAPGPRARPHAGGHPCRHQPRACGLRRTDAARQPGASAHRDPVAPDRRHPRQDADRQSAGRPAAIDVCLNAVFPAIPYCLDLIGARPIEVNPDVCVAFRPGA